MFIFTALNSLALHDAITSRESVSLHGQSPLLLIRSLNIVQTIPLPP